MTMMTMTMRPRQQQYRMVMLILSLLSMSCLFWFPNVLRSVQRPTATYFDNKTSQQIERMIILTKSLPSLLLSPSSSSSPSNNNTYRDHRNNGIMMTDVVDDDDDRTRTTTTTGKDDGSVIRPRAWPIVTTPLPCEDPWSEVDGDKNETWWHRPVQKRSPLHGRGLFYLKLTKSASSTAAGVHLRVAHNLLQRRQRQQRQRQSSRLHSSNNTIATTTTTIIMNRTTTRNDDDDDDGTTDWPICRVRFLHGWAGPKMFRYGKRDLRHGSFLWTTVRHPTPRAVSEFFHFHVGRHKRPASFRSWKHFTKRGPHSDHHSLSWLSVRGYRYGRSDPYQTAQRIVRDYDFIGVVERLDESFVVLSLLLHVPLRDVLYVSSKVSGTYDDLCVRIPNTTVSPAMEHHIRGESWQSYIAPEVALWEAANESLDLTIEQLGKYRVATTLRRYRSVMAAIRSRCTTDVVRFPCTVNGTRNTETDCFVRDMGCGWDCIDQIADEMGLP